MPTPVEQRSSQAAAKPVAQSPVAPVVQPDAPASAPIVETAAKPEPLGPRVVFTAPSYPGSKPDIRPNVADGVVYGVFIDALPAGLMVRVAMTLADRSITTYLPIDSPTKGAKVAIVPERIPATNPEDTDDGMRLAPGAKGIILKLTDAVSTAWELAKADKSVSPYGRIVPLSL